MHQVGQHKKTIIDLKNSIKTKEQSMKQELENKRKELKKMESANQKDKRSLNELIGHKTLLTKEAMSLKKKVADRKAEAEQAKLELESLRSKLNALRFNQ